MRSGWGHRGLPRLWLLVHCWEPNEVALQDWGFGAAALQSRTEAIQSAPSPILKWLGHRKLNLTLLTLGPPTTSCLNIHPHHTTSPLLSDTQLTVATTRLIYIFWYGYRGWKRVKKLRNLRSELEKLKSSWWRHLSYQFSVSCCGGRCKEERGLQWASFRPFSFEWVTTTGASAGLLGLNTWRDL